MYYLEYTRWWWDGYTDNLYEIASILVTVEIKYSFTNNLNNPDLFLKWDRQSLMDFLSETTLYNDEQLKIIVDQFFCNQ